MMRFCTFDCILVYAIVGFVPIKSFSRVLESFSWSTSNQVTKTSYTSLVAISNLQFLYSFYVQVYLYKKNYSSTFNSAI